MLRAKGHPTPPLAALVATLPLQGRVKRARCSRCALSCASAALRLAASAQDNYPSRQVTHHRALCRRRLDRSDRAHAAEGLTARLGQTVIVENKPGGNGVIGIREAIKARPDGYTLLMGAVGANVTPAAVQPNYPFDPLRDYVPVSMVAEWSAILVVKKDLPVDDAAGVRRLCRGAAGRAQLRHHRLRQLRASGQRAVHAADRRRACSTCSTRAARRRPPICWPARSTRT